MDKPPRKIIANGAAVGIALILLLGGLALVVRSLRNAEVKLSLDLKRNAS